MPLQSTSSSEPSTRVTNWHNTGMQDIRSTRSISLIYMLNRPSFTVMAPVIKPHLHDTTCCQTGLTTGCMVYTNIQPVVKPVRQPVWQPAVSCIQPVVKPVVQPVWQPVGCLFTRYNRLSNRLYNRFENWLYHVNGVSGIIYFLLHKTLPTWLHSKLFSRLKTFYFLTYFNCIYTI